MNPPRLLLLAPVALLAFTLVAPGQVAAFCEILEPPTPIPTQVNGTQVEIQLTEGFARVVIVKEFYNPSDVFKEGQIFFPLEKGHELITDLSLKIGNVVYNSTAQDRGDALDEFLVALANGKDAALVQYDPPRDVYWIAVTIPPRESRTTITTLEMPLAKRDGFYEYDYRLSVDAGHSVAYLRVHVRVATSAPLAEVAVPTHPDLAVLRRDAHVADAFINSSLESQFHDLTVRFRSEGPSVAQYADAATGERYVRFSIDIEDPMFSDSLRPLPRSFLFLVDGSGSMELDDRWPLAREATLRLARDLRPGEGFAAAVFQGKRVLTFADTLAEATPESFAALGAFLGSIPPVGSTSLTAALPWIERWAAEARLRGHQAILFLITDGRPTRGDAGLDLENAYKRTSYDHEMPVFALAVKPRVRPDATLLRNLSHLNSGEVVTLRGSDVTAAVSELLESVRVPVLQGLRAELPESIDVAFASENPQVVVEGGEALVIAKLRGSASDPFPLRLSWADRGSQPSSFERVLAGADVPAQSLLKKQWVLTRVHALLEAARARADPVAIAAVTELATANRIVTPYTSLLVAVPTTEAAGGQAESRVLLDDLFTTGTVASAPGPTLFRAFVPPLIAMARDAEALRNDLQNPLIVDREIDRTVREGSAEHQRLGLDGATIRFQGRFVTIAEVNDEIVAVVRGWLDPVALGLNVVWTVAWLAAAALTLVAMVRLVRGRLHDQRGADARER